MAEIPLKAIMIAIDHFDVITEMGIEWEVLLTKVAREEQGS